ncbi:hypothetical protein PIB30_107220, partial [Stylosanthes scabra]|nr:hypothetical protein [Stylosanthes scabra]
MKRIAKAKNREEGSSKGKVEEEKARRKIELKCASVDDLIDKLKAFKGALYINKELNTPLGARPFQVEIMKPSSLQ